MTRMPDKHLSVDHNPSHFSTDELLVTHLIAARARDVPTSLARVRTKRPVEEVHSRNLLASNENKMSDDWRVAQGCGLRLNVHEK
jgi:hypothetical protein